MFGDDSIEKCGACLDAQLPEFPEENIVIHGGLEPTTEYLWFVETVKGNLYKGTATTNADGDIELPFAEDDFPEGLFSSAAGRFIIYFQLASDEEAGAVTITLQAETPYAQTGECIELTFYRSPNYTDVDIY